MQIKLAGKEDEEKLLAFFEKIPIEGSLEYEVKRPRGFFYHAKQNFSEQYTLILEDDQKKIQACLSINVREAWINGWKKVGWASDLRVSNHRKSILYWFDHFLEEVNKVKKENNLDYIFSFINKTNQSAFNTFIRPKVLRPHHPRFHLLTNFFRVSVYSTIPSISSPISSLRIRSLDDTNMEVLTSYLQKKSSERFFSYNYSTKLILERLKSWSNFNKENFLIAYDVKSNIVGCVALWNAFESQYYKIIKYNDFYENMRQLTRFSSFLGLSKNMPPPNSKADFYFLTHLRSDNSYIFQRLLHEALEFCHPNQYIVYSSFEGDRLFKPPRDMLYTKSKFGLYLVLNPDENLPFSHISSEMIPDFEVAFL